MAAVADMKSPHNIFKDIIQEQSKKEDQLDIWKDSPYKDLVKLQSNNVGNVGEKFINNICKCCLIEADCDGSKTKQIGGGKGDGIIMGNTIEVKTSHQGSSTPSFQHELGEKPWNSQYMIFVDVAPKNIYLTIFKNFEETTYKSGKKLTGTCFPTKSVTWRKKTGAFKLDTTIKINETNIENGYCIKINHTTSIETIASFIKGIITLKQTD